jgi:hypothetical protein
MKPLVLMILTLALGLATLAMIDGPPQQLPVVEATPSDYQRCVTIQTGPLRSEPRINGDNRHRGIA